MKEFTNKVSILMLLYRRQSLKKNKNKNQLNKLLHACFK